MMASRTASRSAWLGSSSKTIGPGRGMRLALLRADLAAVRFDERHEERVQHAVRRDHAGTERRGLVEDERLALEARHLAAGLFDEDRAGADVPLVLSRE